MVGSYQISELSRVYFIMVNVRFWRIDSPEMWFILYFTSRTDFTFRVFGGNVLIGVVGLVRPYLPRPEVMASGLPLSLLQAQASGLPLTRPQVLRLRGTRDEAVGRMKS